MEEQKSPHSKIQILEATAVQTNSKLEAEKKLFPYRFVEINAKKEINLPSQKISLNAENEIISEEESIASSKDQEVIQEIEQAKEELINEEVGENNYEEIEKIDNEVPEQEIIKDKKFKKVNASRLKSRLKLGLVAMVCVLTCFGGWAIYNAIKIKTLTAEAELLNEQYKVSVVKVIANVSKLDDLTNTNSITNLDELASANIVEVLPKSESFPKTLEKQSNWFDRVCNWLSNLFK